jgi:GGDEF domain-containing protein
VHDGTSELDIEARPSSTPLPVNGWCADARQDPITGLVAFPDFNFMMPEILAFCHRNGLDLGIAIGDVDNLKEYVESAKGRDPSAFGHIAGCALMQSLGVVAVRWFDTVTAAYGCVSTFGGDEIIVVLAVEPAAEAAFELAIIDLRNALFDALPRSVSFGWTVAHLNDGGAPTHVDRRRYRTQSTELLSAVDRALFRQKSALRAAGLPCAGFVTKAPLT